jgi:mannobiose 2-epimerase
MKNHILTASFLAALILSISFACLADTAAPADSVLNPSHWKNQAITNLIPFWENTIDTENGGFFTNINEDGTQGAPANKYPRMISRVVFGFCAAYLLSGDDKYLEFAKHGMDYLSAYGFDKDNGGWYTTLDETNEPNGGDKNLFDETYGNLGLTLYYFTTGDKNALSFVEKTHALMRSKAWDAQDTGYYASVGEKWDTVTTVKSFNAELDTCTAYLIYYYMATRDPALLKDLTAIGDMIIAHMIDKNGFVGESFNRDWTSRDDNLWVGHNLKTGWVLTRIYYLTGDKKYLDAAETIASGQMKYTWDKKYAGWFFHFDAKSPATIDDEKDWWTQEEGNNLMMSLYHVTGDKKFLDKFTAGAKFWDKNFVDKKYGEVYDRLKRNGTPMIRSKADPYKSAYHSMEHALTNYLYLNLYKDHTDAELYFRLSADAAGEKHYVNLLEDPSVIIKSVEIDGKEWADFKADEGYVTLPAGRNMKVKVTFGVKAK